jgi:hypothetical protein
MNIVIWQCREHPEHRGWRDESNPAENMRRGTCDVCFAVTAFEREMTPTGAEERPPAGYGMR